jgi:phospholipid N-methyltransferase
MKNLEKDQVKILLNIIGSNPSLQIAHFTQSGETITDMLSEYCQARDYLYQINTIDLYFYEKMSEKFRNIDTTVVKQFPLERQSYMMQGRQYDFLFVTASIEEKIRSDFLKRVHQIIRNAGNIIIFIPKGDINERYSWTGLLEDHNYVATNTIDNMFKEYDIVISKKMHGWGG